MRIVIAALLTALFALTTPLAALAIDYFVTVPLKLSKIPSHWPDGTKYQLIVFCVIEDGVQWEGSQPVPLDANGNFTGTVMVKVSPP